MGDLSKTGNKKKTFPFTETVLSSHSQIREQAAETAWRLAPIDLAKSAWVANLPKTSPRGEALTSKRLKTCFTT